MTQNSILPSPVASIFSAHYSRVSLAPDSGRHLAQKRHGDRWNGSPCLLFCGFPLPELARSAQRWNPIDYYTLTYRRLLFSAVTSSRLFRTKSFNSSLVLEPFNPGTSDISAALYSLPAAIHRRICLCRSFRRSAGSAGLSAGLFTDNLSQPASGTLHIAEHGKKSASTVFLLMEGIPLIFLSCTFVPSGIPTGEYIS